MIEWHRMDSVSDRKKDSRNLSIVSRHLPLSSFPLVVGNHLVHNLEIRGFLSLFSAGIHQSLSLLDFKKRIVCDKLTDEVKTNNWIEQPRIRFEKVGTVNQYGR